MVFVISRIVKVKVSVISRRLKLITLTETLIIPDIAKTKSQFFFVIHCFKENNDKCFIAPSTVYFQLAMLLHELDITLGNHALRHCTRNLWIIY